MCDEIEDSLVTVTVEMRWELVDVVGRELVVDVCSGLCESLSKAHVESSWSNFLASSLTWLEI